MRSCLICDDHALVRAAIAGAVSGRWPEAEVLQAGDFTAAWALAARRPDLVLTDLGMPGAAPADGVGELMRRCPSVPIIVVTGSYNDAMLMDLLAMGVAGFLPKTSELDVMLAAIALVLAGGRYLPPRVAELLAPAQTRGSTQALHVDPTPPPSAAVQRLTDRQRSVLRLIALGHSNKQIALALGLSPATVKTHVAQVLAAINATNRTEAAVRAREGGLV